MMLNRPAKASIFYILTNLFSKGAAFFLLPLFTHRLTTEEYGLYALFTGYQAILTVFATWNLTGGSLYRGLQKNRERAKEYCASVLLLLFLTVGGTFLLFLLFREPISSLGGMSAFLITLLFLDVLANAVVNLYAGYSRYRYRAGYPTFASLMLSVVSPLFAFLLLGQFDVRAESRIYASVAVAATCAVYPLIKMLHGIKETKIGYVLSDMRYALKLSLPMLPHTLGWMLLAGADKLLIERLCPAGDLGKYALAYSCAMALAAIGNGVSAALGPWIMRKLAAGEVETIRKTLSASIGTFLPVILLFLCILPEIFAFLAPAAYQEAMVVVYPAALAVLPMFLSLLAVQAGTLYEKPLLFSLPSTVGAALNVGLNLMLLPRKGYAAAGYVTLLSYTAACALSLFLLSVKSRAKILDGRRMITAFLLAAGGAVLLQNVSGSFAVRMGCFAVVFTILAFEIKNGSSLLWEKPMNHGSSADLKNETA